MPSDCLDVIYRLTEFHKTWYERFSFFLYFRCQCE